MRVIIATNNAGKVREYKKMLAPLGFDALSLKDAGVTVNVVEDGETFHDNARKKAREIHEIVKCPVIADDSGLEVDYLGGEPGVYSARYGGERLTDSERNGLILQKLEKVPKPERTARFVAVICFTDGRKEICVSGEINGFIGDEPMGVGGFGYDPIFMVRDNMSMAMLSDDEKNRISHRGNALAKLIPEIKKLY